MVKLLLEAGADATAENKDRESCLHFAAEFDQTGEFTKILLEAGAKEIINNKNKWKSSPLQVAVKRFGTHSNKKLIVKLLVDAGAKLSKSICSNFCLFWKDESELFKILLRAPGADDVINCPRNGRRRGLGIRLFQDAVRYSSTDLVKQMIDLGVNVNFNDRREGTPLHIATYQGDHEKVHLLLKNAADPDALNNRGESVIAVAAKHFVPCCAHMVRLKALLQHSKKNNEPEGATLRAIVQYGSVEAFEFYIHLAEEGIVQKPNNSLLIAASMNDRHPVLHYLLDKGICTINEEYGSTALHELMGLYSAASASSHSWDKDKSRQFCRAIERLIQSVALLESKKRNVEPAILDAIKQNATLQHHYERCTSELHDLQSNTIDGPITYHSIVAKHRVIMWVKNELVMKTLELFEKSSESLFRIFPIYHSLLQYNIREMKRRQDFVEGAVRGLQTIIRMESDTFFLIYQKILYYLNIEDLSSLGTIADIK